MSSIYTLLFEFSIMGTVCENVMTKNYPQLEQGQPTRVSFYEPCAWPDDPLFHRKYEEITNKPEDEEFFSSKTLQRHRVNDEYYLGEWDVAGYQKGRGILYRPGELLYYGNFDSVPHGKGVLEDFKNQFVYEGQFNYGKIEGKGKLKKYNHAFSYEGNINADSRPTTGVLTVNSEEPALTFVAKLDNYPFNKAIIQYRDGRKYEGLINISTFMPEGEGKSTYPNGSTYEGDWRNGEFHGHGKFIWNNGSAYEGEYQNGKKQGHGKFIYPNKKAYKGKWVDGKQEGQGSLFDQNGHLLKKGIWSSGVYVNDQ